MTRILPVAAVLAALALAGCGTETPMPTPTATASETPTATPTPTPTPTNEPAPEVDGEVLFVISAKLTAPDGATASIKQTVYQPFAELDDEDDVEDQLDEECNGWRDSIGEGDWLVAEIVTADTSTGTKEWDQGGQVAVTMAGAPVYQGDLESFQSSCTSVQVHVPGTVRGVTPLDPDGDPDEPGGWATFTYGFMVGDPDDDDSVRISNCRITLTDAAKAESTLAKKWTSIIQSPGLCEINTPGV